MARRRSGPDGSVWDRVVRRGEDDFVSVLADAQSNPLWSALERLARPSRSSVVDLGCGRGELLAELLGRGYARVLGVDSSAAMLARARRALAAADGSLPERLELRHARFVELGSLEAQFDLGVSLNSLIDPDPISLARGLAAVCRCLRPGGVLLAVFPAHETLLESARFHYARARARGLGHERARKHVEGLLGLAAFDPVLGVYQHPQLRQKYLLRDELSQLLSAAGFETVGLDRVVYQPHVSFTGRWLAAGEPAVWHWFVSCRRGEGRAGGG